ncbi:MAG: L-serine ammonia-lyase, iron-sulfur-dependent, subunit alpha [Lachnospiraceae bacterium]|nr:L-serine ammonia-lyase, iron-sulfur-dependent, subunit alpha [Lachnospiraceae bacterium]
MKSKEDKLFYPDFFNDVFGPIMQPGSSGGFAGTDRIGRMARHALRSNPKRVKILLNPSEKRLLSLGTWMEDRAYLGGLLDMDTEDIRLFDAHAVARAAGLSYEFGERESDSPFPHSSTFLLEGEDGDTAEVLATSIGGGMIRVHEVNGFAMDFQGDTYGIFLWEKQRESDISEVRQYVEDTLGEAYVATSLLSHTDGRRGAFIESSDEPSGELLDAIRSYDLEVRVFPAVLPVITRGSRGPQLFDTVSRWREIAKERGLSFVDTAILYEQQFSGWSRDEIWTFFERIADVLDHQVHALERLNYNVEDTPMLPVYGKLWKAYEDQGKAVSDSITKRMIVYALSTNAKIPGVKIVPGPMGTGGGYLYSAVAAISEAYDIPKEKRVESLIVAAGFGMIAYSRSNPSGERGCVGESGVCAAMAAAAVTHLIGGDSYAVENAASMALQASFGITCDAIPGGLEFPCLTRTLRATVTAPLYADLACAGINPLIPWHEVVDAMELHYRRTEQKLLCGSQCGLNCTPTAKKCMEFMAQDVMKDNLKYEVEER